MSAFATVIGLAAAACTTVANLPQLKKAWTTGETDVADSRLGLEGDRRTAYYCPVR